MTAKEFLDQIKTLDTIIKQKRRELNTLHEIATTVKSFDYSGDKVQTSPKGEAPFAKTAERAAELDEEIRTLEDRYQDAVGRIEDICDGLLTDEEHDIIVLRYYNGWKWSSIMETTGQKDRTTYRLHNRALEKLQEIVVPVDLSV